MPHNGKDTRDRNKVQSVERSLDLLEALSEAEGGIGILDLSARVSLHASTAHRLLSTLLSRGYVCRTSPNGLYALGPRALALAQSFSARRDFRFAHPFLEQLMEETGETANLSILDRDQAVYIDQVPSPRLVRMFAAIGRHVPLHSTGCGKVLLAHLDPIRRTALVQERKLERSTRFTITSSAELERELADIRRRGYAEDNQENDEGVRCVAAPVRDHTTQVIAAISVSGPTTRVTKDRISGLSKQVMSVASQLSAALGCTKPAVP